ncbi:MAG: aspartate aminotransferase family protein [Promethearchaeia archaeon]
MNYEEIMDGLERITSTEMKGIPDKEMAKIKKKIAQKCQKSKQLYEELETMVPGGSMHQLVIKDPFAISMKKSLGQKMWDVDDNEYIDYLMSAGACILGHNYPKLREEIIKVYKDLAPNTYWNTEWENKAIKMIQKHMPSIEGIQYFQSGTEADMAAMRIARVFTGNTKIIKFGGSYHGWGDQLTYDIHIPHSGAMESDGIPKGCYKNTISLPPADIDALEESLEKWTNKRKGVAAVMAEPLGAESGALPVPEDFNKQIRGLCDKYDVLLIFDEVVTGFRVALGGAQKYLGVKPDLTVFGKLLTHGFPSAGAVGGRKDIMNVVSGDVETGGSHAFIGGTMRANPLTVAATYWTIKILEETNTIEKAAKAADDLVDKLNELFERHERPFFAHNYKSCVHFETFSPQAMDIRDMKNIPKAVYRKQCVDDIATVLLSEGFITKYGNRAFTSLQHTPEDNDKFIEAFEKVLELLPNNKINNNGN